MKGFFPLNSCSFFLDQAFCHLVDLGKVWEKLPATTYVQYQLYSQMIKVIGEPRMAYAYLKNMAIFFWEKICR